jgi:acetoacetate decarboxylase
MRKEDVLKLPSMPAAGPSYPAGPYRFVNREYMVITYETDALALRAVSWFLDPDQVDRDDCSLAPR